jgi:hypothetical protein
MNSAIHCAPERWRPPVPGILHYPAQRRKHRRETNRFADTNRDAQRYGGDIHRDNAANRHATQRPPTPAPCYPTEELCLDTQIVDNLLTLPARVTVALEEHA